jgi:DNA-binding beta-propeller fold protein YncE
VVDTNNHRVQKFTSNGGYLTQWGSQGSGNSQFKYPTRVAVDGSGNVYVADTDNHRLQKFTGDGQYITQWGGYGSGNGQFARPHGIALDSHGNVYVADRENNRIQKFTNMGNYITQWGLFGGGNGEFNWPEGITVDRNDNIYVADTWNHRIQKFTSSGVWLGTWGREGSGIGQFSLPAGIVVDTTGNIFVADRVDNRIQIFRPMTYTRPIATIVAATPRSVVQGQPVELLGMGGDSDTSPNIAAYEWTLDGSSVPFATGAQPTLSTSSISPGQHTIAFRVRDTEGEYSDPQTISIDISPPVPPSQTWTFLLYLDGDNGLGAYLNRDSPLGALYKLQDTSPNPNVRVVALYDGDRAGGGDSFRYVLQPNGQFTQEALGEVDMGDPQTLINFVQWGKQQAPADHYYLAIADHANGLDGIAWDYTTPNSDHLTNAEIRQALVAITENGAHPIDVLHFDGCLMGLLENAYQVRNLARYLVTSENLGWSAFAYELYRLAVGAQTSPAAFASIVADRYALQVANAGFPYTIAALDLSQIDMVTRKTDALAVELLRYALASEANRTTLQNLRAQVQKFDSSGDIAITNQDEYIDLDHWATLLQSGVSDAKVQGAASDVRVALLTFVVSEHHASGSVYGTPIDLDHARGVGIYYPPQPSVKTYQTYVRGELNFVTDTYWDEFLAAGLAPLPFDPSLPIPNPVAPLPIGLRIFIPIVQR